MKKTVTAQITTSAPAENVWELVSNFSDASKQTIAVTSTEANGNKRIVTFKNGHQVEEDLIEKNNEDMTIKWKQESKKGFIPIKNIEIEIKLQSISEAETVIKFTFNYDTIMGHIGMMMNFMMIKSKLTKIAQGNLKKIAHNK